jgi:alpha-glucosidase
MNSSYMLPFIPGSGNLDNMTMSLNGTHYSDNQTEYNLHNLNGHMQAKVTNEIMLNYSTAVAPEKRPFMPSRSTFAGSGAFAQHWNED